jgi:glycosyltransferase involved in cell wall biosynthesis
MIDEPSLEPPPDSTDLPNSYAKLARHLAIVNTCHAPASLYNYSRNILESFRGESTLFNLLVDAGNWRSQHFGIDVKGRFTLPTANFLLPRSAFPSIARLIRENCGDNAIVHYVDQVWKPLAGTNLSQLTTFHDNPVLAYETNLYFDGGPINRLKRRFFRRRFEDYCRFDNAIAVSNYVRDSMYSYGFRGTIKVVYPMIAPHFRHMSDKAACRTRMGLPADQKLVLSVSTNLPRKNLAVVERTMSHLGAPYRLVRVGSPVGDSITFRGLNDESMNLLYNACDALLQPSIAEGCPGTILEALACGLPVVASDIDPIREVASGVSVLAEATSIASLANGVREVISSPDEFCEGGLRRATRFSRSRFADGLRDAYRRLN